MILRRLVRVLDYVSLFFSLVILSSLLWAGAGLVLIWAPLFFVAGWLFPLADGFVALSALYIACLSGSVGLFWGLKRWRQHLEGEAAKARRPRVEKPQSPRYLDSE